MTAKYGIYIKILAEYEESQHTNDGLVSIILMSGSFQAFYTV
jgi:hypothetical protein